MSKFKIVFFLIPIFLLFSQQAFSQFLNLKVTPEFNFSPSIGIDVFTREGVTGKTTKGVIPTAGYGLKWVPGWSWLGANHPALSIDLFIAANFLNEFTTHDGDDYFAIDLLPVLTILDWVSIGFGQRFKIGIEQVPSRNLPVFSFGVHKSI